MVVCVWHGTATGKYHAGVLSSCAALERRCVRAGLRCGELAHALPFAPEQHFTEFSSVVADMKNSVAGERATGYGVALLNVLFGAHTNSRLIRALAPGSGTDDLFTHQA
ncbi:unnamed protein product [Parnassius apollo]|uniref:(apollo) hypothetical protein n=1 Tax=Parnassius apollo TaxID=110799 RepID=A0A8S3WDD1_PARAO|nr:unnamed protein product [Parnassius apollo]